MLVVLVLLLLMERSAKPRLEQLSLFFGEESDLASMRIASPAGLHSYDMVAETRVSQIGRRSLCSIPRIVVRDIYAGVECHYCFFLYGSGDEFGSRDGSQQIAGRVGPASGECRVENARSSDCESKCGDVWRLRVLT